ncbi:MAG: hypothetical protein JNM34_13310, partial [Chthonomonadaceae bacterium]|nr:hypothetical protein [Chthonomonadaceae bacterium]
MAASLQCLPDGVSHSVLPAKSAQGSRHNPPARAGRPAAAAEALIMTTPKTPAGSAISPMPDVQATHDVRNV